jgi:hypothetical protein
VSADREDVTGAVTQAGTTDGTKDGRTAGTPAGTADVAADVALLGRLGYAQELRRRMSAFSNFAIAFSTICILAGGITSLQLGVSAVGGAAAGIVWPLGVAFSLVVALSMAQVASAFPTAGGLYHWSAILGGKGWGWATAWFNLAGLVFVTAAVNVGGTLNAASLEVPLVLVLPSKDVVTHPHRRPQRVDVNDQARLLRDLADDRLLIGFARVDSTSRRVPPRQTIRQVRAKQQDSTGAVDDERANRLADGDHNAPGGQRLPRAACSRSIDSNSALKLPFPKPLQPLRWITSKNSVGRSPTGRVKICSR